MNQLPERLRNVPGMVVIDDNTPKRTVMLSESTAQLFEDIILRSLKGREKGA